MSILTTNEIGDVKAQIPKGAQKGWEDLILLVGRLRERTSAPAEMIRRVLDEGYETYLQTSFANFAASADLYWLKR